MTAHPETPRKPLPEGPPRVRFAPSPTGSLHLGAARTALLNWLFARRFGGCFILRVEDTDRERSSPVWERGILDDLCSLGLFWDEGPDLGGPFGPYRQSERLSLYRQVVSELDARGHLYSCYCTSEELAREREDQLKKGHPPRYSRRCLNLPSRQKAELAAQRLPSVRMHVPDAAIEISDQLRGSISFPGEHIGDFVAVRPDGWPAYNFAAAVDDHMMEITDIIRGEEHLSNTPRQAIVYRALGWKMPRTLHVGLILGPDGEKLSKRHGAASIGEHLGEGILPSALLNFLGLLGWTHPSAREIFLYPLELAAEFLPERLSRGPAVFDRERLLWVNRRHMRELPPASVAVHAWPYLTEQAILSQEEVVERSSWIEMLIEATADSLESLRALPVQAALFLGPEPSPSPEELGGPGALEGLRACIEALEETIEYPASQKEKLIAPYSVTTELTPAKGAQIVSILRESAKKREVTVKSYLAPVRVALTGSHAGPELPYVFALLGKEKALSRLRRALRVVEEAA